MTNDPATKKIKLYMALHLMKNRILDGFSEEFEYTSYDILRIAHRAERELRKLRYKPELAYRFSLSLVEVENIEVTQHIDMDTIYMMGMNWIASSYTFISKEVVDVIKENVYHLCFDTEVSKDFIRELTDEIKEKIVEKSLNSRPIPSSEDD